MTTAITGGTVITASDTIKTDVLIDGERIIAMGEGVANGADSTIDATDRMLIPGGIDVHTHLSMPFGGTVSCDNYTTGHAAALWGGTTMHIDFATQPQGESLQAGLDAWAGRAENEALMDYGFHMIVTDARDEVVDEMQSMVDQGVTSFKMFLAYPNVLMVDDDTLFRVMQRAAELNALPMIHAENGPVIDILVKQALAEGKTDPKWHAATRPATLEGEATARAIEIAKLAGSPLFVVHVTSELAASAIARARDLGNRNIMGETCIQYLYLTEDDLARPGFEGAKYVCSPPLRTVADQEHLWNALYLDELQSVSTDHCPFNFAEQKALGKDDFSLIPNGIPAIAERMSLLWEGVWEGRISANRFVELTSTAPAKNFGLYPRKGTIAPGADADIVLWDPNAEITLSAKNSPSAIDYCSFEGMQVHGRAETVLRRGEIVVQDGKVTATPGSGNFVKRAGFGQKLEGNVPAGV